MAGRKSKPDPPPAGGLRALFSIVKYAHRQSATLPSAKTLMRLNQDGGFDCPGCAWPEPRERSRFEFCENGARHVAHETTGRRVEADFFSAWSVPALLDKSDRWLEDQGRLTAPMWRPPGVDHYIPITWEDAFGRIAEALNDLDSPDEAIFYTSGRTSNEAAFLYQLFVRQFGTNNLPDCSNMCHESSGTGLRETLGVAKGTVSLEDFDSADAIFIIGQNPGSNHPRMFNTLTAAKRRGCRIVAINPLRERALVRFAHPKDPLSLIGKGRAIADLYLQVRIGGDVALLKGIMKEVLAAEDEKPGKILDRAFLEEHTDGFEEFRRALDATEWTELAEASGISQSEMREAARVYIESERVIVCWAMGLTQHKHAVANVQEIVNLLLLRGNLGKPGAGACPVRGHSNVQGDRTMGIWERPTPEFLARLGAEFGFEPPRKPGVDTVAAIRAMHGGRAKVFFALGGNFAVASPDSALTHAALARCRMTVQVSTKLNRSHLVTGEEAIVLPCLGRSERDLREAGPQFVTVEDSMSVVHASSGALPPASDQLRGEPAIVAGLARAVLGSRSTVPWERLAADYDAIRDHIARVIPGFEDMNRRVREPGGFVLPNGVRERRFDTEVGRARFSVHPLPRQLLAPDQFLLMTLRSHDQFNTTIYSDDDRYRGVEGDRRVVFLHPDDIREAGLAADQRIDVTSHHAGETRTVHGFRVIPYDVPRRCVGAYYPEANPLVAIDNVAEKSHTPVYKSIVVTLGSSPV